MNFYLRAMIAGYVAIVMRSVLMRIKLKMAMMPHVMYPNLVAMLGATFGGLSRSGATG